MIVTVEEAKKMECHRQARVTGRKRDDADTWIFFYAPNPCRATACPAWRWAESSDGNDDNYHGYCPRISRGDKRRGYCGLAGIPRWA